MVLAMKKVPALTKIALAAEFIKEEIDGLLNNEKGEYIVHADYATESGDGSRRYIDFDSKKEVKIYVKDKEDAKRISGYYNGNAIVKDNPKSNANEK